jgi:hypothetical protein
LAGVKAADVVAEMRLKAAAGLQWMQTNMLKPRPLQLVQTEFLED